MPGFRKKFDKYFLPFLKFNFLAFQNITIFNPGCWDKIELKLYIYFENVSCIPNVWMVI